MAVTLLQSAEMGCVSEMALATALSISAPQNLFPPMHLLICV